MSQVASQKLRNYEHFHKNFVNKVIHYIGIPMIVYSTIALLGLAGKGHFNLASLTIILVTFYYLKSIGWKTALMFLIFAALSYYIAQYVNPWINLGIFAAGWILQIIGHRIYEKNSPAFLKNFEHLLMGPAWFFSKIF